MSLGAQLEIQTTNMDDNDIYHLKLSTCVRDFSRTVLFTISKDLYLYHPKSHKGTKTVNQMCLILEKKKLKDIFSSQFPKDFKYQYTISDSPEEELDLSFCARIIKLLKIENESFRDKLEELIKGVEKIISIRNTLCHKYVYSFEELTEHKKSLVLQIQKICDEMKQLTNNCEVWDGSKYDNLSKKVIGDINHLWQTKLGKHELDKLSESRKKDELYNFVAGYRNELKKNYEGNLFVIIPGLDGKNSNIKPIKEIYIPVDLLDYQGSKMDNVLSIRNEKSVVILSDVGQGKSVYCKNLIHEWLLTHDNTGKTTTNFKDLAGYDLLLYIDGRLNEDLPDYLTKVLMLEPLPKENASAIYHFLKLLNILIIIDGINEATEKLKTSISTCFDLLSEKFFIITSKPDMSMSVRCMLDTHAMEYDMVYPKTFEISDIKKYVNKISISSDDTLWKFVDITYFPFCDLPNINILLSLWIKSGKKNFGVVTCSSMYNGLYENKKEELVTSNKMKQKVLNLLFDSVMKIVAEFCYSICKNEMNYQNKVPTCLILQIKTQVHKLIHGASEKEYFIKKILDIFFLNISFSENQTKQTDPMEYQFLYETQVKWLAAYHIVISLYQTPHQHKKDYLKNQMELFSKSIDVLSFIFGILSLKRDDYHMEMIISLWKFLQADKWIWKNMEKYCGMWKILCETITHGLSNPCKPNHKACMLVSNSMTQLTRWTLTEETVISALSLLHYVDLTATDIEIQLKSKGTNMNPSLMKLLAECQTKD